MRPRSLAAAVALALAGTVLAAVPAQADTSPATCTYTLHDQNGYGIRESLSVKVDEAVALPLTRYSVAMIGNPAALPLPIKVRPNADGNSYGSVVLGRGSIPMIVTPDQVTVSGPGGQPVCSYDAAGSNPAPPPPPPLTCTFTLTPAALKGNYQTITVTASRDVDSMAQVTYLPDTDLGLVHRTRGKRLVNATASMYLPGAVLSVAPASDFLVTVKKTVVCTYVP